MHTILSKRMIVVFVLGFASGLPLALITSTLQAWFSDVNMSLYVTGMLSLLGLPYLYRFLWAPLLDKYSLFKIGKRKSWILTMQVILCLGFNLMAWMSPQISPLYMAILAFILATASATQDAAIDAYRIELLNAEEYGLGASLATLGYRMAMLVSGGSALLIAQYVSWPAAYRVMGVLMLVGAVVTLWSDENGKTQDGAQQNNDLQTPFLDPIKDLAKRRKIIAFCLFIIFYKLGEVFTTNVSGVVMPFLIQGLGFSLATIAYINKILGFFALIAGGLTAGFILLRYSLFKSMLFFGLIQSITNALFILLATVGKNTALLAVAVTSDNFAAGLGSTATVALFMSFVNRKYTATQFSILVAFSSFPRVFSGPIGAFLHAHFGWIGLYQIAFILSFVFIPFLFIISDLSCFRTEQNANAKTATLQGSA